MRNPVHLRWSMASVHFTPVLFHPRFGSDSLGNEPIERERSLMQLSICSYSFHGTLAAGERDIFRYITDCIVGSEGGVRLEPFEFYRNAGKLEFNSTINGVGAGVNGHLKSQEHWIAALQGQEPLLPTAEVALNTMLISEGIYLSEQLGREVTADEVRERSVSTAVKL